MALSEEQVARSNARGWMRRNVEDFVDAATNEANATHMAESAVDALSLSQDLLDDPDSYIWEVAAEVAEEWDEQRP